MASKIDHAEKSSLNVSQNNQKDSNCVNHVNKHKLPLDHYEVSQNSGTELQPYNSNDKQIFLNGGMGTKPKRPKEVLSVVISGNFDFIDDINTSHSTNENNPPENVPLTVFKKPREISSIVIPGDFEFIDDTNISLNKSKITTGDVASAVKSETTSGDIHAASDNLEETIHKHQGELLRVNIPGDYDFIDDTLKPCRLITNENSQKNKSSISNNSSSTSAPEDLLQHVGCHEPLSKHSSESSGHTSNISNSTTIPTVVIPGNDNITGDKLNQRKIVTNGKSGENCSTNGSAIASVFVTGDVPKDDRFLETISKSKSETLNPTGKFSKCTTNIPTIVIPGNFDFADDLEYSLNSRERSHSRTSTNANSGNSKQNVSSKNGLTVASNPSNSSFNSSPLPPEGQNAKHISDIPSVVIPGEFDFIDEMNVPLDEERLLPVSKMTSKLSDHHRLSPNKSIKSDTFSVPSSPGARSSVIFEIPSIYLPSNLQFIDDTENSVAGNDRKLKRGDKTHSSLRIPRSHSTKRRLCRHHSDSEAKASGEASSSKPKHHRSRSKRVRRSVSAIETNKDNYKTRVRRSFSDRSGMIITGKHLRPPYSRSRPHSYYENNSSRCSSTRTLSTNVSISEIVAVEMGLKDIPGLTAKEARRRRIVCTVGVVTITIIVLCVLLLALTLLLSPEVDALLRKGNEEIYRSMAAGASTSSPTTEGPAVVANNSAPPSGTPG